MGDFKTVKNKVAEMIKDYDDVSYRTLYGAISGKDYRLGGGAAQLDKLVIRECVVEEFKRYDKLTEREKEILQYHQEILSSQEKQGVEE